MNNEPAFPRPHSQPPHNAQEGMTLRDYFAAAVLPAMYDQPITYDAIAQSAYNMADAMLIARKKK